MIDRIMIGSVWCSKCDIGVPDVAISKDDNYKLIVLKKKYVLNSFFLLFFLGWFRHRYAVQ